MITSRPSSERPESTAAKNSSPAFRDDRRAIGVQPCVDIRWSIRCSRCVVRGGVRCVRLRSRRTARASKVAASTNVTPIASTNRSANRSQNSGVRLVPTVITLPDRCVLSAPSQPPRRRGRMSRPVRTKVRKVPARKPVWLPSGRFTTG